MVNMYSDLVHTARQIPATVFARQPYYVVKIISFFLQDCIWLSDKGVTGIKS